MGVGLSGCGTVGNMYFSDKGLHKEAEGNNCGVCLREAYLQTIYRREEYGGIQ